MTVLVKMIAAAAAAAATPDCLRGHCNSIRPWYCYSIRYGRPWRLFFFLLGIKFTRALRLLAACCCLLGKLVITKSASVLRLMPSPSPLPSPPPVYSQRSGLVKALKVVKHRDCISCRAAV